MIRGQGLHTGAPGSVAFERWVGPVVLRRDGVTVPLVDLIVQDATRSTTVGNADGSLRVATIEHVLAALGGLGIHDGVCIVVDGPEAPLADGGARAYIDALDALGVRPSTPALTIVRDGVVDVGRSRYTFSASGSAGSDGSIAIEVEVDFDRPGLAARARWDGDAADFRTRIATARTFGFEREVNDLLARGLASHVTRESVVVIGDDRVLSAGAPFTDDEPVRHKLLDLVGDLYLHGGPPLGSLRASRPGHAATHDALRLALARGLVVDRRSKPSAVTGV